jgi:hypothetical protein
VSDVADGHELVRVLVETHERVFKGTVYKPVRGDSFRLTGVQIADRGQVWRVSDKRDFIAIAVSAIVYLTPLGPNEV